MILRQNAQTQRLGHRDQETLARLDSEDTLSQRLGHQLLDHPLALLVAVRIDHIRAVRVLEHELERFQPREVLHVLEVCINVARAGVREVVGERRGQVDANGDAADGGRQLRERNQDVLPELFWWVARRTKLEGLEVGT